VLRAGTLRARVLVKAWLTPATAARPDRDNTSFPFFKTPGGELIVTATKVNIKPLEDRILVQALEAETTTASGIVIPDTAKEKPQEGTVLAVGPGRVDDKGNRIPVDVAEGDIVLYSKYGGTEVKYAGQEYLVLSARDVLAVIVK
jgi:chaperonin GroES